MFSYTATATRTHNRTNTLETCAHLGQSLRRSATPPTALRGQTLFTVVCIRIRTPQGNALRARLAFISASLGKFATPGAHSYNLRQRLIGAPGFFGSKGHMRYEPMPACQHGTTNRGPDRPHSTGVHCLEVCLDCGYVREITVTDSGPQHSPWTNPTHFRKPTTR